MIIMLADDERMVRLGLKSIIDELYPDRYKYIEAKNGKELIEMSNNYKPDIAFVDIKMPLIDGITALREVKAKSPNTYYLILSGYADFEYAREALRLGAIDYLLKPVATDELKKVIEKITANMKQEIKNLNSHFSLDIVSSYNIYQSLNSEDIPPNLSKLNDFDFYIFYIDNWQKSIRNKLYQLIINKLNIYMETKIDFKFRYCVMFLSTGELCLITEGNIKFGNLNLFLDSLINESDEPITIFYKKYNSITSLYKECQNITDISSIRIIYNYGKLILIDDKLLKQISEFGSFCLEIESLCLSFIQKEEIKYKNIIDNLNSNKEYKRVYNLIDKACTSKYFYTSLGLKLNMTTYKDFIDSLISYTTDMYKIRESKIEDNVITQITKYIEDNYMKEIGINSIAELIDISPNYLSKIFHQKVGKKFIDYLTEIRISNAKKIFAQSSNITVKEVAAMVGYISTRHFTKTFTKLTGYLPSEYISHSKNNK